MTAPEPGTLAPRGELLRGAWAFPDDLDERRRGRLSDPEWLPLLLAASELLFAYSGRLWPGTFTDEARLVGHLRGGVHRAGLMRPDPTRRVRPAWVVRLPGEPVRRVVEVRGREGVLPPEGYDLEPPNRLVRVGGRSWRLDGSTVARFEHGDPPPELGVQAVLTYAYELGRARSSDQGCRLPETVTSVTRQGVSYQVINRANGANPGRTGLPEVDQWLESVNPLVGSGSSARPRRGPAAILSPDLPPMARMIDDATL